MANHYLLFAGIAYLFVGGLDLVHTLIYKGMGVFHGNDANPATQLWIAARYTESISLVLAPLFVDRKLQVKPVFGIYAAILTLLLAAILQGRFFPDCFIEGTGLTPFKIISEYIISLILLAALAFLFIKRQYFDGAVLRLLSLSILATIAAEIAFTFYISVYGLSNQIGHYLKIVSFYLIYKAIIQTGLRRPYDLLFRDLKQSRENLQTAHDQLEQRVRDRTAELVAANQQLQAEIKARKRVQQELLKSNRMLKILSECNQCLVHATDEKSLLDTICRNIIEHGEFRFACVALAERHHGKLLRRVAHAGYDAGFFKKAKVIETQSNGAGDPISTIFWTGRPKVVNNIQEDGDANAWLTAAAKRGCASAIILPLSDNGNIMGALMIYSDQPEAFDSQQVELLTELARDAAFGITTLRMQNRRETIEAERQLLATAMEQASECIAIADRDAILGYINPAVERITGLRPQTYIGRPIGDLLTDDRTTDVDTILHQVKAGKPWSGHINGRTLEGNVLKLNVALSPVRDAAQKIDHFVAIIRDITRECQMELQLIQSQKMEAMGTLAGGIAHDFNNILAAINGFTELALGDAEENSMVHKNLSEVLKAGHRAAELVQQILAFSRQTIPECRPVEVKLVVEEAAKLLRSSLPATIEIRQNLISSGMVTADPTQIHQVVMNLGTNAAHAMQEKGGVLEFDLRDAFVDSDLAARYPEIQPGPFLKFTVSDTGHGMTQEIIDHIFEPFYTTKANGEGTGMGLSVVHGIVSSCGGMITVSSELDKGSSFSIFLPAIEHPSGLKRTQQVPIPMGNQEHVLFIDDEPSLVNMGRQILESLGYQVTSQTDGSEALKLIKAQPDRFDLVVTDMTMPKITGDKLALAIKAIRPKLPVILCSGFSTQMDENKAAALGIRAYVRKPVLREQLARIIREVLDGKTKAEIKDDDRSMAVISKKPK
ncbi:MAG: MASE3 domain-containing protein, partial [Desulfobacteraceae bacterium]|jgi:PAS domain S-box-containing protein